MRDRHLVIGVVCATCGAAFVALMALFVQMCSADIPTAQILFFRALSGVAFLSFFTRKEIKGLFKFEARYVWLRAFFGAVSVSCYYFNLRSTSVGIATVMTDLSPIFVALLAVWIFQSKPSWIAWIGVLLSFGAVAYLSSPKADELSPMSLVLGVSGAFAGACAYISLKKATSNYSIATVVWAFSLALLFLSGIQAGFTWIPIGSHGLLLLTGALIASLVSQLLVTMSYRYLSAAFASNLSLTATVWAILLEAIVLKQPVPLSASVACGLVMLGVILTKIN